MANAVCATLPVAVEDCFCHIQVLQRDPRAVDYRDLAFVLATRSSTLQGRTNSGRGGLRSRFLEFTDAHRLFRQVAEETGIAEDAGGSSCLDGQSAPMAKICDLGLTQNASMSDAVAVVAVTMISAALPKRQFFAI